MIIDYMIDDDQCERVGDTAVVARRVLQFALDVAALVTLACRAFGAGLLLTVLAGSLVWLWLSLFGWLLVTVLWPMLHHGRTPAMRWCELRVVTVTGEVPRPAAHVLRCALTVVDGFGFGLVGLVIMAGARRRQRLGDMIAGTLVVRDDRGS
jgi:uncharacterized RDD family membrane protein YckC